MSGSRESEKSSAASGQNPEGITAWPGRIMLSITCETIFFISHGRLAKSSRAFRRRPHSARREHALAGAANFGERFEA
jgi:hypothetical protein